MAARACRIQTHHRTMTAHEVFGWRDPNVLDTYGSLRGRVSQMMRARSLNRQSGARHTRTTLEPSLMRCARENVRLAQENQVLRQSLPT